MIPTTAAQICEAVQGALFGDEHTVITDVSTDSRTISAGAWFVPLAGERFDGHDYIDMVLDRGAAVWRRSTPPLPGPAPCRYSRARRSAPPSGARTRPPDRWTGCQ